jgi:predicted MFS family arabinose efflux permease
MAAMPAGTALGTALFFRLAGSSTRNKLLGLMAVATPVPLALCWFAPGLAVSVGLWFASGLFCSYVAQVFAVFARIVPDAYRGRAIGIASSGNLAVQGIGVLVGGFIGARWSPAAAVGVAGVAAVVVASALSAQWRSLWRINSDGGSTEPGLSRSGDRSTAPHSA